MINANKYTVEAELICPWIGKPYMTYKLFRHYTEVKMDFSGWPDEYECKKLLISSKDESKIRGFAEKLNKSLEGV